MTKQTVFPGTFAEALTSDQIMPGDRLLLHTGVYSGDFLPSISGEKDIPITILPYGDGPVKIDGSVFLETSSNLTFRDIELTFTGWTSRQGTGAGLAFQPYNRAPLTADFLSFADWKALTGLDANSTEHLDTTPPDYTRLSGKANLAVYNWSEAETVAVDVSSVYSPDEVVRVHNAQDYYSDYTDLTVGQDGKIIIPMTGHSVAIPYMDTAALDGSSFPTFGAFLLEAV